MPIINQPYSPKVALVNATTGQPLTSGTPSAWVTIDNAAQIPVAAPTHVGNGQWRVALTAPQMNGDSIGLLITEPTAVPAHLEIATSAQPLAATDIISDGQALAATGGTLDNVATVGTVTDKAGYSIAGTLQTLDALDAQQDIQHGTTQTAIGNLNDFNPATDTVSNVTTVGTVSGNVNGSVGSVVASVNAIVVDATAPGLAKWVTEDTGETVAAPGSVAIISQGAAGGNVTVGSMTVAALAQFATDDTGETAAQPGSVAELSKGAGGGGGTPVDADLVDDDRTWFCVGDEATNVVRINANSELTLALVPDINPKTSILDVVAASVGGVPATNTTKTKDQKRANFDPVYPLEAGEHSVEVSVLTTDNQTINSTATLIVRQ